jgi:hypothetical protein
LIQEQQTEKLNKPNEKLVKKLFKLIVQRNNNLSSTMIEESKRSPVELRRNTPVANKYFNVITERDNCGKSRAEITAYDPHVQLTLLNSNNHLISVSQCELASGVLKSSQDSLNTSEQSSLETTKCNNDNGESIISTCEEHLTTQLALQVLQQTQLNNLKPKSTSSTTSLLRLVKKNSSHVKQRIFNKNNEYKIASKSKKNDSNKSMTFNVDIASTPKRKIPRSSTPKLLNKKSCKKSEKKPVRHQINEPFSSTVLSSIAANLFELKQAVKTIPPPLLSSSLNHDECSIQIDFNRLKYKIRKSSSKKIKVESSCRKCDRIKRKHQNTDGCSNSNSCEAKTNVRKKLKYETSESARKPKVTSSLKQSTRKLSWRNLKYPIKYYPNMKSQDIDRLNTVEDCCNTVGASYECQLKPVLKSSYSYGDYNVWIL